jgi:hypothetical protein
VSTTPDAKQVAVCRANLHSKCFDIANLQSKCFDMEKLQSKNIAKLQSKCFDIEKKHRKNIPKNKKIKKTNQKQTKKEKQLI